MAPWNSRGRAGTSQRSPLAGLFDSQSLQIASQMENMADVSPTISDTSQSNTPTSATFP